jgi:aminopeptidase YwaD
MKKLFYALIIAGLFLPAILQSQNIEKSALESLLEIHVAVLASDSLEGRGLGTEGKIKAKRYIAVHFREFGLLPIGDDYFQHFDLRFQLVNVPGTNVVGYLPGSDPALKDEYIVIGAHYDHLGYDYEDEEKIIYYGADDNASGTAVLIEMARHFSKNPDAIGRSIIFIAFDAEESGLIGAYSFLNEIGLSERINTPCALLPAPSSLKENGALYPEKIRMMFSLDMVGMLKANRSLHLRGIGSLENGEEIAKELATTHNIRVTQTASFIPMFTDTKPFGEAGIPAAHAFTGMKSPYHKPEDTFEKLDYQGMAKITRYLNALITELSKAETLRPSSEFLVRQQPKLFHVKFGVITHLGASFHRYPDEFYRAKSLFAAGFGALFQVQLGKNITAQPELLYDYEGSEFEEGNFRRHSILIPLNLQFSLTDERRDGVRFYPFAGGYFRHSFWGEDFLGGANFKDNYNHQEFGITLGFGLDGAMGHVGYTWRGGLTNISKTGDQKFFFNGNYFTLGFKL